MAADQMQMDFDPRKVLQSLQDIGVETKRLAAIIDDSLGKNAAKSINTLEESAQKGTGKIESYFRNLGTRIREDLKTAFDASGIVAGAKFAKDLGDGVRQVLDMERAFDRLNTRLMLSNKQMNDFKNNVGRKVSATGQKLEDVLPGVETAAAKGGVKSPEQLAAIGEALAQAKATTGEGTDTLADTIVEILKNEGKEISAKSFKETLDAMQGTRVSGAFKNANDAGTAIEQLSPYAKQFGLSTREMGGMAATASGAGSSGNDILRQLLEKASKPGGMDQMNAIFGQKVFNNGKLDQGALGKINTKRFGQFSQQAMEEATGLSGASGADLARFVDAFKNNMDSFKKVTAGANETSDQFAIATDNFASGIDRFKEKTKEAAREIGESVAQLGKDAIQGNFKKLGDDASGVIKSVSENKGQVAAAGLLTAGVGILAGGAINRMLGKLGGGAGGLMGGVLKGEAAKAAGIEPVYVVNASEIGNSSGISIAESMSGPGSPLGALMKSLPGMLGSIVGKTAGVGAALYGGYAIGEAITEIPAVNKGMNSLADMIQQNFVKSDAEAMAEGEANARKARFNKPMGPGQGMSPSEIADAVTKGTLAAHEKVNANKKVQYTNPSTVSGRGRTM